MNRKTILTFVALLSLRGNVQATTWYVATNGSDSASGTTTNAPFLTPAKAMSVLASSDTIYVFGGTYMLSAGLTTSQAGTPANYCRLWAYPGEHPFFNYSNAPSGDRGITISKNYWHIKGIEVGFAKDNGIIISANSNIVEGCVIHECTDDGITFGSTTKIVTNNLILNCDSYKNYDPSSHGNNGDGYSGKQGCGPGNAFQGCRAWLNSDDGWDFYNNVNNSVTLSNCWSFQNGSNQWNDTSFSGNGNGFKLGGQNGTLTTHVGHVLKQCLAFDNHNKGFDHNQGLGNHTLYNCTGFRNANPNFSFYTTPFSGVDVFKNNISYAGGGINIVAGSTQVSNSWQNGLSVTAGDFVSIDVSLATAPRNADYSLPTNGFARLAAGSDLIDAGINVGLPFNGPAPDLGAYEFSAPSVVAPVANFTASPNSGIELVAVTFTDTSTGTTPLSLNWNLGDSFTTNTAGGASFSHSYAAGLYTVTLTASNSAGTSALVSNALISVITQFQAWQLQYFGCTNCSQAQGDADADGDGLSNTNEFLAGTNPTNPLSGLRITSAVQQGSDIVITWATAGGRTNVVQVSTPASDGSYTNNFSDTGASFVISGAGDATTNYVDSGASTNGPNRYYRIRLVP
jgi:PKD repeat protein